MLLIAAPGLVLVFAIVFGFGRGRPVFVYNMLDLERFQWERLSSLGEGKHTIVFDFTRCLPFDSSLQRCRVLISFRTTPPPSIQSNNAGAKPLYRAGTLQGKLRP
jgi:hypothetical protein